MSNVVYSQAASISNIADDEDSNDDNFAGIRLFFGNGALTADDTVISSKISLPSDTDTETQAIKTLIYAYKEMLSVPLKKARKFCIGEWDINGHQVAVANPVNTISRTSGKPHSGLTYLDPEEWLLFYERGVLEIHDKQALSKDSLADVWTKAVNNPRFKLHGFRAYAILRRLGYTVLCLPNETHVCHKPVSFMNYTLPKARAGITTYSYADVFYGLLQRSPSSMNVRSSASLHSKSACASGSTSVTSYSVYNPDAKYKKRDPPTPQHTLVAQSSTNRIPSADDFVHWEHSNHEVSALFCVSEPGSTGFLSIKTIEIQTLLHK